MLWTTYRAQELVLAEQDAPARATEGIVDRVTFDQVAVAAMRLANMLDPTSPGALIELRADAGSTLRRSLLETVAAHGASTVGYANGRIPADVLCPLEFAPGHLLRCDAAERLTALSAAFEQRFGYPIPLTDSYRSLATQVAVKGTKPHLAAIPGTSNHGWGLAVDLDDPVAGGASAEYVWLRLHGPDYGWDNPSWARLDGAKPEPWHFEFFAAGAVPDRAVDPSDVGTWAPGGAGGAHEESAARPATHVVERPAAQDRPGAGGSGGDGQGAGGTGGDGAGGTGGDGAGGTGGDDGAADAPDTDAPPAPAPAPAEPPAAPPTEPPAEEPDAPAGLVEDVVGGTVGLVTGTVDGVVGGLVGGLLGAGDTAGAPTD
nr:hypothetical protein GCM10025730_20310 [Promicromonospora thailandica]